MGSGREAGGLSKIPTLPATRRYREAPSSGSVIRAASPGPTRRGMRVASIMGAVAEKAVDETSMGLCVLPLVPQRGYAASPYRMGRRRVHSQLRQSDNM